MEFSLPFEGLLPCTLSQSKRHDLTAVRRSAEKNEFSIEIEGLELACQTPNFSDSTDQFLVTLSTDFTLSVFKAGTATKVNEFKAFKPIQYYRYLQTSCFDVSCIAAT